MSRAGPGRREAGDAAERLTLGTLHGVDALARLDSPVHRLDPRAKILATLAFIVTVMSFDRHAIGGVLPFALFPAVLFGLSGLPARPILTALAAASPFALLVGLFNPLFERQTALVVSGLEVSAGWISFASILIRAALTVSAAAVLVATTGMHRTAMALERLGVPRVFVLQLLFVYRYLFVLGEEAASIARAVRLRSFGKKTGIGLFGRLAGSLLLRTLDRAVRIHRAMVARGFDGTVRFLGELRLRSADLAFCGVALAFFALARAFDLSLLLGRLLTGGAS